jgi:hypothetical protein
MVIGNNVVAWNLNSGPMRLRQRTIDPWWCRDARFLPEAAAGCRTHSTSQSTLGKNTMSWFFIWLYFVTGEFTALLALRDEEGAAQVQWLAQKRWWAPYVGTMVVIIAWPAAVPLLLLLPKKK